MRLFNVFLNVLSLFILLFLSGCAKEEPIKPPSKNNQQPVYWTINEGTDGGAIMKGSTNPEGKTKVEILYDSSDGVRIPFGIAVDTVRNYIYWVNSVNSSTDDMDLVRAPLDGTGSPQVIFHRDGKTNFFMDLILDIESNRLYLSNSVSKDSPFNPADGLNNLLKAEIIRIDLEQPANAVALYSLNTQASITDIKLDKGNGRIYWSQAVLTDSKNNGSAQIMRGSIDGQQTPVVLYDQADGLKFASHIAVDAANNKLYINSFEGADNQIGRTEDSNYILMANLDGSGTPQKFFQEEPYLIGGQKHPIFILDMDLNPKTGNLYWMNSRNDGEIKRMKLTDRSVETSYTGLKNGIFFHITNL
ncbi:hypothetical protein [Desertivirga xinjiangensis]|uniref:hypothetical protein n=1 Tax=Desertivirga xinjiangensis TaxID=539206 RepID=UPI00210BBBDC|nr:hypothetical protein [Pedobacter xinjiangensis]